MKLLLKGVSEEIEDTRWKRVRITARLWFRQFLRGWFLLILENDCGVNYTSRVGIALGKFHTLQSLSSSFLLREPTGPANSVEYIHEIQRCGPGETMVYPKMRGAH